MVHDVIHQPIHKFSIEIQMKTLVFVIIIILCNNCFAQVKHAPFRVLAIYENGGHHALFSKAGGAWLDKLAAEGGFNMDYINNTDSVNDDFLAKYQLLSSSFFPLTPGHPRPQPLSKLTSNRVKAVG